MINLNNFYRAFDIDALPYQMDHVRIQNRLRMQCSEERVLLLSEETLVHDKGMHWLREQNEYPNLVVFSSATQRVGLMFFYQQLEDETDQAIAQIKETILSKNL